MYVRDSYVCADENYRLNIRSVNEYPWCNLFAFNMFLRPEASELENFKEDWVIINAPGFEANPAVDGTRQSNFSIINFSKKVILIGGSGYTGEIKKGVFSSLNFILPVLKNAFPMHSSTNIGGVYYTHLTLPTICSVVLSVVRAAINNNTTICTKSASPDTYVKA